MRSRLFEVVKDHEGSALVEFTLVLPVLMFLILGLALDSTAYTDTVSAINSAAGGISGLSITLSVNGTPCTTNSGTGSCQTALQNANAAGFPPQAASVTVSYTCASTFTSIIPASFISLTGICPLKSTMQQPVE
jgi:hypothetical protein